MTQSGLSAESVLQLLEPVVTLLLLAKLVVQRLHRRYRYFTIYLLASVLQAFIPLAARWRLDSKAYGLFYFLSEPVIWTLCYLVVLELFDLILAEFPGIRSAARLIVKILVPVSILISIATALPSVFRLMGPDHILRLYFVAQRTIIIELLLLLAVIQFVMMKYRLQLPRNTIFYSLGYTVFFSAFGIQGLIISEGGSAFAQVTNIAAIAVSCACLLFWALTLSRRGEVVEMVAGPKISAAEQVQLRAQLSKASEFMLDLRRR